MSYRYDKFENLCESDKERVRAANRIITLLVVSVAAMLCVVVVVAIGIAEVIL